MTVYLDKISEFSIFLSIRNHSLTEILDHLLRVVLSPDEPGEILVRKFIELFYHVKKDQR